MATPALIPVAASGVGGLAVGLAAVLAVAVAGVVAVAAVRKRTKADDDAPGGAGFTLSDLRRLHRAGQMSDEEYERAREAMVAAHHKAVAGAADAAAAEGPQADRTASRVPASRVAPPDRDRGE